MQLPARVQSVIVLGGGSAGLIAALTLKRRLPALEVEVIRSPEIGIIGVGEGTTTAFPRHFFEYLKMAPAEFFAGTEPTWKMGIHFLWGPHPQGFYYTFHKEYKSRWAEMQRNTGFYCDADTRWVSIISACMAQDKAFPRKPDGQPHIHNHYGFHIENRKLVSFLESQCITAGVRVTDGTVETTETGVHGIAALRLECGRRAMADLYVDASGFRSELLGRALGEEYLSYEDSLFCDRAVIGGWPRTDEPIKPFTCAETMDAGWCWQIEHENWINRGYVYASRFISDDEALAELRRKNDKIANEPRMVKFRSGRYRRHWVGNVVGVGNSIGFVEPLEATALQVICLESSTLADTLSDSLQAPTSSLVDIYNTYNSRQWDDIRDFLSIHYRFNTRRETPFWRVCREETNLAGAGEIVRFFQENGPSVLSEPVLFDPNNSFGLEGYLTLLIGQAVPHQKPYTPLAAEAKLWRERLALFGQHASRGLSVKDCLAMMREKRVTFAWA